MQSIPSVTTPFSQVDTSPLVMPGSRATEYHPTYGPREWIYVKNGEASTAFAAGNVAMRKAASGAASPTAARTCALSTAGDATINVAFKEAIVGVAQHAIAAGSFGWIGREGVFLVKASAATIDIDEPIITALDATAGTAGEAGTIDATYGAPEHNYLRGAIGLGLADAASTATALCYINCRG